MVKQVAGMIGLESKGKRAVKSMGKIGLNLGKLAIAAYAASKVKDVTFSSCKEISENAEKIANIVRNAF